MVLLTRIYTKGGDKGKTSLGDGTRVHKSTLRIDVIGTVDEANASLGLCRLYTHDNHKIDTLLARIQNDLFDIGADLCVPGDPGNKALRILSSQVIFLEGQIDFFNESLKPLTSFILPGGSALSAHLHMARTLVRRAERLACALFDHEPILNLEIIKYLNRLSDMLFVLSREANDRGDQDVLWVPGQNRS